MVEESYGIHRHEDAGARTMFSGQQVIARLDTRAVPRPIKRGAKMVASSIPLAKQVIQAQSIAVTLDDDQERRFQRLVEETTMIDLHQHPMVKPEDPSQLWY